jgi:hypothetical protein
MFAFLRNYPNIYRMIASYFLVHFISLTILPSAYAITSGPSQPETQAFKPMGASDMVDLFSGDFSYNIPLFELPGTNGGYPFNLSYHGNPSMDEEASWVGLGWNLNVGAINRNVRGLPDEFNGVLGDYVEKKIDMPSNKNYELNLSPVSLDINIGPTFSTDLGITYSLSYSNTSGFNIGFNTNFSPLKVAASSAKMELSANYNFGLGFNTASGATTTNGMNLTISNKSQDSKAKLYKQLWDNAGLTGGFSQQMSSRTGLVSQSLNMNIASSLKKSLGSSTNLDAGGGSGGEYSLYRAGGSYSPSVDMEMRGFSGTFDVKLGISKSFNVLGMLSGLTNNSIASLTISDEAYRFSGEPVRYNAFGYMCLQNVPISDDNRILMDVNREKDRAIRKSNKYLATSNLMPDTYTLSGHGIGGGFRPFRRDIGFSHDNQSSSSSSALSSGMTFSPSLSVTEFGTTTGFNSNISSSGKWEANNTLNGTNKFEFRKSNPLKTSNTPASKTLDENIYFKLYGESTIKKASELENIANGNAWQPVVNNLALTGKVDMGKINPNDPNSPNRILTAEEIVASLPKNREERNTYIQPIYNEMITKAGANSQVLREYKVSYLNKAGSSILLVRDPNKYKPHHIGGFTVQNTDGTRYIYALPVYNLEEIEYNYSIEPLSKSKQVKTVPNKPDQAASTKEAYQSKQTTSAYPYAYMLTAVIGADYIDADLIEGPSDGDAGYWVKFTYRELTTNAAYQWRAPFRDANYIKGQYNVERDDKAAITTGKKEIYYLYSAETTSHKAVFNTSERLDANGVREEFGTYNNTTNPINTATSYFGTTKQHKLDNIKLYSKMEIAAAGSLNATKPISTVNLTQTYELCKGVANNENTYKGSNGNYAESGKLTLKKISFTYENSSRGTLSPYEFVYTTTTNPDDIKKENPDYDSHSTDRWGTYKKTTKFVNGQEDTNDYYDSPYTNQEKDYERDFYAGIWSLKKVNLPSGASIEVNYESDDYATVQDKTAMQMYEITGVDQPVGLKYNCKSSTPKVYFKLPEQAQTLNNGEFDEYLQSFTDNAPVYIKAMIRLKADESSYELISGFMDLGGGKIGHTADKKYAYVQLQPYKGYHPLSVAAWQHLQTAQPQMIYKNTTIDDDNLYNIIDKMIYGFEDMLTEIKQGYYSLAASKNWGTAISKGWIRLNNTTGKKYGGGARVKRILVKDNWRIEAGEDAVYGQVYDYTMPDAKNPAKRISSGVAAYEPSIGGEENALKYGIKEHTDIVTNSPSYFFEAPINESHYPGASVGYQRVSVKSLASAALAKETVVTDLAKYFGSRGQFAASGEVVHEFYTAKDFPIITSETPMTYQESVPGIGAIFSSTVYSSKEVIAAQGFAIETNDMHGKQKAVTYYAQNAVGEVQRLTPVSWVRYQYQTSTRVVNGKTIPVLDSKVPVIMADAQLTDPKGLPPVIDDYLIGVDYDLFADARQYTNVAQSVKTPVKFGVSPGTAPYVTSVAVNLNPPPYTRRTDGIQIMTFNKVINRSGILKKTEAFDGGAIVSTENHYWGQNGEVLVSSVDNNFGDKIYTYNIPAYFVYDLTGFAAKGQGLEPTIKVTSNANNTRYVMNFEDNKLTPWKKLFALGDEWHIYGQRNSIADEQAAALPSGLLSQKWIVVAMNDQSLEFEFVSGTYNANLLNKNLATLLYRSGRRNQLSAKVGHITILGNKQTPVKEVVFKRNPTECVATIQLPKCLN